MYAPFLTNQIAGFYYVHNHVILYYIILYYIILYYIILYYNI